MSLFSLLGIDRWIESFSEQMRQAVSEGSSAIEARVLLAKQEWAEEKRRLQQLTMLLLICVVLLLGVLGGASIAVVVSFWDTPSRITAAWCVVLFWGVAWAITMVKLVQTLKRSKQSFVLTKQELAEDWSALKERI